VKRHRHAAASQTPPRVIIIVQNLPVPFDRRVWLECRTLVAAGYDVTVVCPRGKETVAYQVIDDVTIHAYRPYAPGGSALGFVMEYAYSFLATARLVLKARRKGRFDVMQACNPPDIFWPLARFLRFRDGTRFVFDHHDLCPELYESRFTEGSSLAHKGLLFLERQTFRAADRVTSTNESYAAIAVRRGDKPGDHVTVVRTGPDPQRLKAGDPDPALRCGRAHLVAYIGVMGPQDGVDIALAAADRIVHELGRTDVAFTFMGGGDCHAELVAERDRLGLQDYVELPGRVSDEVMTAVLSTADLGVCPDPRNPLNDVSTMNKTMEYMAFGLPVVSFDLVETRVSAEGAALYVEPNRVDFFADAILELLDAPERRARMGRLGRRRVEETLAWEHQAPHYLGVFDELTGRVAVPAPRVEERAEEAAVETVGATVPEDWEFEPVVVPQPRRESPAPVSVPRAEPREGVADRTDRG
jgi:glycosyltransferase involved in cell wall biosynthesis